MAYFFRKNIFYISTVSSFERKVENISHEQAFFFHIK